MSSAALPVDEQLQLEEFEAFAEEVVPSTVHYWMEVRLMGVAALTFAVHGKSHEKAKGWASFLFAHLLYRLISFELLGVGHEVDIVVVAPCV